jgi:hypothetical protein
MCVFVMDKSGARAGFLRELRFPLPIYIPSASPQSSSLSPVGWHNAPGVAAVPIASQSRILKKPEGRGLSPDEVDFLN